MNRAKKSLIRYLVIGNIVMFLIPLIIVGFISTQIMQKQVENSISANITVLSNMLNELVDDFLNDPSTALENIKFNFKNIKFNNSQQIKNYLNTTKKIYSFFETIELIDDNGKIANISPYNSDYIGLDVSTRDFFTETRKSEDIYWSDTFTSFFTGAPTVALSTKVGKNTIVGFLNLKELEERIVGKYYLEFGTITILDEKGIYLVNNNEENVNQKKHFQYFDLIKERLKKNYSTFDIKEGSQDQTFIISKMNQRNWYFVLEINKSKAFYTVSIFQRTILISSFIVVLVAILFVFIYIKSIINTLKFLIDKTKLIALGDYSKTIKYDGYKEFISLVDNFNIMQSEISVREEKLKEFTNNLEGIVNERTRELEEKNALLKITKEAAEAANKAKSEFLATMSHEIRTPINAIVGFNHLFENTVLTEKQKEYLNKSQLSAKNLLNIINDILDFSKIEANKIELEIREFALSEIIASIQSLMSTKAFEKGIAIDYIVDSQVPPYLISDPVRLNQVLLNLVNNAMKFTERGNVVLKVITKNIDSIRVTLEFKVEDTGIGMDKEQIERLFNPFTQGDSSITRKYGGTGLGLSISKRLVELMGGQINVESAKGSGSCFAFTLNCEYSFEKKVINSNEKVEEEFNFSGKKILVVEDNEINQVVIQELLISVDAHIEIASNGLEAVKAIETGNNFDIILMDLQMPVMDGYEATRRITKFYKNAIIIAMTADVFTGVKKEVQIAGMCDYITKPIYPTELYKLLKKWMV